MSGPSAPPAPPTRPPRPPRRRVLPVVVLLLVALIGSAVGVQQRQVAAGWQARAAALEEQRDDARGRTEALQRQLEEIADSLALSESDVAQLEDRVRDLADEKAQAEDVATTTGVERDVLVDLASQVADAVTALDGCVDQLFDLLNDAIGAFNRQAAGEDVDVGLLNVARTATTAECNAARTDGAAASARADLLLR